uniref:Uncharacterized protein n=1 Tax=Oryza barthii TaxID=65489 RepID=A0A0D3GKD6_9ORYZ
MEFGGIQILWLDCLENILGREKGTSSRLEGPAACIRSLVNLCKLLAALGVHWFLLIHFKDQDYCHFWLLVLLILSR